MTIQTVSSHTKNYVEDSGRMENVTWKNAKKGTTRMEFVGDTTANKDVDMEQSTVNFFT